MIFSLPGQLLVLLELWRNGIYCSFRLGTPFQLMKEAIYEANQLGSGSAKAQVLFDLKSVHPHQELRYETVFLERFRSFIEFHQ
jgi:hypothetical protein